MHTTWHDSTQDLPADNRTPLKHIFAKVNERCCLQENVTDLLCPESGKLQLREDLKNGVYVEGLSEEVVTSGRSMI